MGNRMCLDLASHSLQVYPSADRAQRSTYSNIFCIRAMDKVPSISMKR